MKCLSDARKSQPARTGNHSIATAGHTRTHTGRAQGTAFSGNLRLPVIASLSILIALSSGGCASMSREELILQSLHAADVMQTLQIAKNTCNYSESDPITKRIIGENPSERSVIAWGVGSALAFHWVSQKVDESDGWERAAWYGAMILTRGQIILGNEKEGIHLTSVDKECP